MMAENPAQSRIPILDPHGQVRTIDQSEYQTAIDHHGFQAVTPEQFKEFQLKSQYGEGIGNELKAFGEGAARGATFGLSDQFLTKTGSVSPEALRARQEYNPTSSGLGEVAGVVAPSLLSGGVAAPEAIGASATRRAVGEAASVASAPVRGVMELGQSAARASAPLVEKAISNPILQKAATSGIGSAVEGAAYGLGQSVSEQALGDPDLNAEKVLSNVGFGAMLGGTFGAAFGGGEAMVNKYKTGVNSINDLAPVAGAEPATFQDAITHSANSAADKESILSGLKKQKENVGEVKAAASALGVPTFVPQLSASEKVVAAHEIMTQGASHFGVAESQAIDGAINKVNSTVEGVLKEGATGKTAAEAGKEAVDHLLGKATNMVEDYSADYAQLGKTADVIPVSPRSIGSITSNILKIPEVVQGVEDGFASSIVGRLKNVKTLDDLDIQIKALNRTARAFGEDPNKQRIASIIRDKLNTVYENTLKREFTAADKSELWELRQTAKRKFADAVEKLGDIGGKIGKSKISSPLQLIEHLENKVNSDTFIKKLFAKNDSAFLANLQKEFPELAQMVRTHQREQLLGDTLNKTLKNVEKLPPEAQKFLFRPDELKKLDAAKTYMEAFPSKLQNGSKTAHIGGMMDFYTNPIKAGMQTARDFAFKTGFEKLGLTGEQMAQVHTLTKIERAANAVTKSIQDGAKSIFSVGKGAALAASSTPQMVADHKKVAEDVQNFVKSPHDLMNNIENATQWIYKAAPNHAGAVQMAAVRAATFLQTKIPKNPNPKPLGPKYIPSPAESAKFMRYYNTIQAPVSVLKSVKMGMLTVEQMETLHNVFPSLLSKMQASVMDHMTETMSDGGASKVPYSVKMSLSMFLGQDLVQSLEPQQIASMQMSNLGNGKEQAKQDLNQAVKVSQTGLSHLSLSQRSLTTGQELARRPLNG
jgi:hypothetical protein